MYLVVGATLGCGKVSTLETPDSGIQPSDASASDASASDANDVDAPTEAPSSFEILGECDLPDPCAGLRSYAQLVENMYVGAYGTCVLEAMQERTAGTYLHESVHTFTNGTFRTEYRFIVRGDGTVTYAYRHVDSIYDEPVRITALPAQRCQLQPADYFATCRDVVTADALDPAPENQEALTDCMYIQPSTRSPIAWFTSCEPTDDSCE